MPVAMAEDTQGVVVSVVSNLFRVSRNQFVPYSFKDGQAPPFIWIYNLVVGRDDSLWVASVNGIFRVKDGAWQQWSVPQGLSWVKVHWIFEDSDGVIWAGGPAGMARLKYNQIRNITRANGLFDDFIFAIVPDDLGYFWVDSARGIFRVSRQNLNDFCDGKTDQVKCEAYDGLEMVKTIDKTDQEWSGCKTKDGRIWFPSSQGVVMIDPAKLRVNSTPPPVYIKQVSANGVLVKDWNAAVTLSGKNESGSQTSPDWKPSVYSETDGLLGGSCHAVSPSQNGGVWATMNMGVSCFEGNQSRNYTAKQLPNAYIKRILEAKDGDVYLTDADKAVEILAHGKIVARYTNSIWPVALTEDAQGVVVSVGGDLFRVDRNRFAPYPFKNGQAPPCYWIFNLTTGRDGSLWIATVNGIFQVKDGTFQQWSVPEGLPASNVYWVCEDNEGVIWAGLPTGVARLKNNRFRNITRADGLFDDVIYAMVPDNAGFFWVNSSQGVFRVSRKDLNDFADGRTDRVKCEFYRETEGTDQEYSGCMSRDGCIWFPSSVGVLKIDPSKLPNDGDRPFAGSGHVRLGPSIPVGKGELEFQFFALSYVAPQHIRYRFQLEGWNKDWIECGNQRSAFYTNLKPGKYRFRVEACNADGVWSTTGDSFAVELLPHFYQTTWFYMGCAVLVSAALMGIYAWRMGHLRRRQNQLQKAQELLEAKVEERTEELEAQKTRLESEIEERKRMQLEVERVHRLLVDASRQAGQAEVASSVLHNVGNVLNSVNTSASIITDQVRDSKVADVSQVAELLIEHQNDLAEFLVQQGRGEPVTNYLKALGQRLVSEQATMLNELQELVRNIDHIKEIVAMQQSYAQVSGIMDKQSIPTLVDDALRMHAAALARHQVQVVRQFDPIPDVLVDKHKVLQILVNLISNAKYALSESAAKERRLALGVKLDENNLIRVSVADNGVGIPEENLDRIFSLGFTTRQSGHGLGLHSGFFAAREMGGTLLVHSDGPGKGATFTLVFPAQPEKKS
jgi:signal transduction histidine kinase/ligand-binding sensor domain-containing protein